VVSVWVRPFLEWEDRRKKKKGRKKEGGVVAKVSLCCPSYWVKTQASKPAVTGGEKRGTQG